MTPAPLPDAARLSPREAGRPYDADMTPTPPTTELGTPGGVTQAYGIGATGWVLDSLEQTTDLRFPASAAIYDRMRKEDGLIASSLRSITSPIESATWRLEGSAEEGGDVPADVMAFVRSELGLDDTPAGRRRRRRHGIVLTQHVREALLHLVFGFMPFEVVYEVGPASPGQPEGRDYAHLRKLGPRMPRTVQEVKVGRDGGLAGLVQTSPSSLTGEGITIPVDRLVWYVNAREGADWTGQSLLRPAYKHWLIKDELLRRSAQIIERNGMGVPVVTYDPAAGHNESEARALAVGFRGGSTAGAAVPVGMAVQLKGVDGKIVDPLPLIEYHDRKAAQACLTQFLELGHTGGIGQGNVASVFARQFKESLNAVARTIADTITEHVIRDLVELNYGPEAPYPVLAWDDFASDDEVDAAAISALVQAGVITLDPNTEAWVRKRYGMPEKATEPAAGSPVQPAAEAVPPAPAGLSLTERVARLAELAAATEQADA